MTRSHTRLRRGATAVETAVVLSVLMVLIVGLIAGGAAVFRNTQTANLSREGARYASVRGSGYQRDNNTASPTRQQIVDQAVLPFAAGIDPADLDVTVEWIDNGTGTGAAVDWDSAAKDVRSVNANGEMVTNTVRVTVACRLAPVVFGGATCRTVCELPMSN